MEIEKLRTRLKNISKGVPEYRMTVTEARNLLTEIDALVEQAKKPAQVVVKEVSTTPKILDGGSFID